MQAKLVILVEGIGTSCQTVTLFCKAPINSLCPSEGCISVAQEQENVTDELNFFGRLEQDIGTTTSGSALLKSRVINTCHNNIRINT